MFRKYLFVMCALALLTLLSMTTAFGTCVTEIDKPVDTITDASIVGTVVLSSDTVWHMIGRTYVEDGEVLIIEPGTIIKGDTGQAENASVLVVARGGKIYAEGTQDCPIIFTSILDDVDDPNDIPFGATGRGLWGGIIILGKDTINTTQGWGQIEGIPSSDTRARYGSADIGPANPYDTSGIIRYVSIRHGGTEIGAGNEINGLTMGAVGSGTIIEHVEVYQNLDDGYEWFGGSVNTKYLVSAFNGDDCFDYDEGFNGNGQFWFAIEEENAGDRGGEHDGGTDPEDGLPYAQPDISNATYIGSGVGSPNTQDCFKIRDNAGGYYYNSIFTEHNGVALTVEDLASGHDSRERLETGDLDFNNNIWWSFIDPVQDPNAGASAVPQQFVWDILFAPGTGKNNDNVNPEINAIDRSVSQLLDPRPNPTGPAASGAAIPADPFFDVVSYKGAFDPDSNPWIVGWTALDNYGVLANFQNSDCQCITDDNKTVVDVDTTSFDGLEIWQRDTVYHLVNRLFVREGDTLIIEPGTVIKGDQDQGDNAAALVVARGGIIYALGAKDCPIVFTSELDDVDDPNDIPFGALGRGLWGGVIILGKATINTSTGWGQIEGIPASEMSGRYGGGDIGGPIDDDFSGYFKHVSIRHGGTEIGAGNEINGLTMGAVGSRTVIEYVEVYQNLDDGYEWFGGSVNTKYLVSAFNGDDCFDYDEGFNGNGQFWFAIEEENAGDRGGEHDGGTDPEDGLPYAQPDISNATYIGSGVGSPNTQDCFKIRDNAGGYYYNSIFTEHNGVALTVEDLASGHDSRERLETGDLDFNNNIWWSFIDPVQDPNAGASAVPQQFVWDILFAPGTGKNNDNVDPQLMCVNRGQNGQLDPRPDPVGPAASGAMALVDPFFTQVNYLGAFDPGLSMDDQWISGWTFLFCGGFTGEGHCSCCQNRGNVDGVIGVGGPVDVGDLSYLVAFLFQGGPQPPCTDEGNVDGVTGVGGPIDVGDLSYLVAFLFQGGPPPPSC